MESIYGLLEFTLGSSNLLSMHDCLLICMTNLNLEFAPFFLMCVGDVFTTRVENVRTTQISPWVL